jgi:hypothetical protein
MASDPFTFPYTPPSKYTAPSAQQLNVFLLRRRENSPADYEEFESFVVVAWDAQDARRLVHDYIADHRSSQPNSLWMDGRKTSTLRIGQSSYWLRRTIVMAASRGA